MTTTTKRSPSARLVGDGGFGCVFTPALPCANGAQACPRPRQEDCVGKVFFSQTDVATELNNYKVVQQLDPDSQWSLPVLSACPVRLTRVARQCVNRSSPGSQTTSQLVLPYGGATLREAWRRYDAVDLVEQALRALTTLHDAGYVHMDVKPDNMVVDNMGRLRLIDFGLMTPTDLVYSITHNGYNLAYEYQYFPPEFAAYYMVRMGLVAKHTPMTLYIDKHPRALATAHTGRVDAWGLGQALTDLIGTRHHPLRELAQGLTAYMPYDRLSVRDAVEKLSRNKATR